MPFTILDAITAINQSPMDDKCKKFMVDCFLKAQDGPEFNYPRFGFLLSSAPQDYRPVLTVYIQVFMQEMNTTV